MQVPRAGKGDQARHYPLSRTEFQVLSALCGGPRTLWGLLAETDGTIRHLYRTCRSLARRRLVAFRQEKLYADRLPRNLTGVLQHDFAGHFERFSRIVASAPAPTTEFFQERILQRDLFRRIEFLYRRGDLYGRRIFVLGDDDLFSLAVGLTGLAERIVVAEIDERLVEFIARQARKHRLPVEVFRYNAAEPLPKLLRRRFDVFVMDPVETESGFTAWLSRGLAALAHPGAVYFGLTELECPPLLWHRFQRLINESGLVMTDMLRDFTRYENRSLATPEQLAKTKLLRQCPFSGIKGKPGNWYRSTFHRAITIRKPRPPIRGRVRFDRSFYHNRYVMTLQ